MLKSIIILLLAMSSIQFGASQAKTLIPVLGAAGASTLRLVFASLMMLIFFRPRKIKLTKDLLIYGTSLGLMNFCFYFALNRIPLGIAVALEFTGPLAVALFSSQKKIDYLWALMASVGILLLFPLGINSHQLDPIGLISALMAGLFWGLYIIFGKKAGENHGGGVIATMGMLVASLVILPFGLVIDGTKLLNPSALPFILVVAFFGSALPYSLEMIAMKKIPRQTFGVLMSLEPAIASLMGVIFLAESLTQIQWLAIICVMVSTLGSSLTQKEK